MLWIVTAVTLIAGIVARLVVILVKRPADVDDLGSVSDQWVGRHRAGQLDDLSR